VITCYLCARILPPEDFYASERGVASGRCKPCFRKRVNAANKKAGRGSASFSAAEIHFARTALKRMLTSADFYTLSGSPAFASVLRKFERMGGK
jgi:hypothetical protein